MQRATADRALAREPARPTPLVGPTIALMAGIWLSETIGPLSGAARLLVFSVPLLAFVALLLAAVRWRVVAVVLVATPALAVGFARQQSVNTHPPHFIASALSEEPVLTRLAGRIVTSPAERPAIKHNQFIPFDPAPRTQFVLAVEELRTVDPPRPATGQIRVSVEATGLGLRLGQRVQLSGKLYLPQGPRNPGERDWARWYRHQGIAAGMNVEAAAHLERLANSPARWHALVSWLRATARGLLLEPCADADAPESARLLDVMVLGQRSAADRALNEAFLRAGGMHFLAVSGFHVGVLAGSAWWITRRLLRRGRRVAAVVMMLAAGLYALVAEPNAPVLRAAIITAVVGLALIANRPLCLVNWLALAAACILLVNPLELFRAGFQLSFVQVLGLVAIVPALYRIPFGRRDDDAPPTEPHNIRQLVWMKLCRWLKALLIVCTCAYVVAIPLTLFHFGRFAPWGWLGTVLLSPLVIITIVLSLVTMLAGALLPPLSFPLGLLLRGAGGAMLWLVHLFEPLPWAVIQCQPPPAWLVLGTYLAGLALALRAGRARAPGATPEQRAGRRLVRGMTIVTACVVLLLALSWLGSFVLPSGQRGAGFTAHILAVGNGSAALLAAPGGQAAVYDVGTDTNTDAGETAARALRTLGLRRLRYALVSHANFDHYSGLPTLVRQVPVQRWMSNPYFPRDGKEHPVGLLVDQLPAEMGAADTPRAGGRLSLGDAALEVLWPPTGLDPSWSRNDHSLVVRLTFAGRSVLFTGDIERRAMAALLQRERAGLLDLKADVLIAPHHGAVLKDITADFCAAVSPSVVVASTRAPRPRLEPMVRDVLGPAARVVTTGGAGAIVVRIMPDGELSVETPHAGGSAARRVPTFTKRLR